MMKKKRKDNCKSSGKMITAVKAAACIIMSAAVILTGGCGVTDNAKIDSGESTPAQNNYEAQEGGIGFIKHREKMGNYSNIIYILMNEENDCYIAAYPQSSAEKPVTVTKINTDFKVKSVYGRWKSGTIYFLSQDNEVYRCDGFIDDSKELSTQKIEISGNIKQIMVSPNHAYVVTDNGDLYAWVHEVYPTAKLTETPTKIGTDIEKVVWGTGDAFLVISKSGKLYTTGTEVGITDDKLYEIQTSEGVKDIISKGHEGEIYVITESDEVLYLNFAYYYYKYDKDKDMFERCIPGGGYATQKGKLEGIYYIGDSSYNIYDEKYSYYSERDGYIIKVKRDGKTYWLGEIVGAGDTQWNDKETIGEQVEKYLEDKDYKGIFINGDEDGILFKKNGDNTGIFIYLHDMRIFDNVVWAECDTNNIKPIESILLYKTDKSVYGLNFTYYILGKERDKEIEYIEEEVDRNIFGNGGGGIFLNDGEGKLKLTEAESTSGDSANYQIGKK